MREPWLALLWLWMKGGCIEDEVSLDLQEVVEVECRWRFEDAVWVEKVKL